MKTKNINALMLRTLLLDYLQKSDLKYSIYIKDLKNNELCCINENEIVASASIIKIFIMGVALELAYDYFMSGGN